MKKRCFNSKIIIIKNKNKIYYRKISNFSISKSENYFESTGNID